MSAPARATPAIDPRGERRRFLAREVLGMFDAGILTEEDRVELVEGELLTVNPRGPDHRSLKDELHRRLLAAYSGQDVHVLNQGPVVAGPIGLPEPDLAVVRGAERAYLDHYPTGADLLLVVEVSKTSHARDRAKVHDYARGGVPVYWLLDLRARVLEVFREPHPESGSFGSHETLDVDDDVDLPGLTVRFSVGSLLP